MKNLYQLFVILFLQISINLFSQSPIFSSRGIGGGGALFECSINPANNNEYYIACDMGELFHTTDFGLSYSQVHFQELIGGHNSKVCFTSTSGLLYSISYANDMMRPMKSIDNGVTWTKLIGNPDDNEVTYSINADYNNPQRIIISYYNQIYFSTNGGNTFTSIHTALTSSGNTVGGVFFDGNNIFIGTNDGVLVSTNAGATWSTATISGIPSNERIWSFAAARKGSTTRFYCITANVNDIYVGVVGSDYYNFPKGIYSVDYGSGNWVAKQGGISLSNQFPMFVKMANNNIDTLYLAGSNSNSEPIILKTTNAGNNWTNTFNTVNNQNIVTGWSGQGGDRGWSYGECPFGIAVAPNDINKVIFGDFGFVHKTNDGGGAWQQAYINTSGQNPANLTTPPYQNYQTAGIENTTCWQVHWMNASTMWACFSDIRGIKSSDAGVSWSFNYTGHTANTSYRIVQHPSNGTLYAATSNVHDIYQSTYLTDAKLDVSDANGKIIYSTNNGQTWQNLKIFNHPVYWITLDPNNPNRAYASVIHYNGGSGVGGIYICNDLQNLASSTWTLLANPPRTEKHPACIQVLNDGKMVCTYSGRRTTSFTASSGVFVYDPTLNSWTDVSDAGMYYWTKDIIIDPNDVNQNTWYACVFSGWGGAPNGLGGLYKTTNRGSSWTKLTASTIDRVTSCTFNPNNANQIYITTEGQGLWLCNNINSPSPNFNMVQSYPFQQPERVFFNPYNPNEMWVTSFGNGMKMADLTSTEIAVFEKEELIFYPNPTNSLINFKVDEVSQSFIYNLLGEKVGEYYLEKGLNQLDLSGLKPGIYFVVVGNKKGKIILSK